MRDKYLPAMFQNFWGDIMKPFDFENSFLRNPLFSEYGRMKVFSDKNQYTFQTDIPGFSKEEIRVNVKEGVLEITAKQEEKKDKSFTRRSFNQKYLLPEDVNLEQDPTQAKYENGVLELVFSKKQIPEKSDGKEIKID